MVRITHTVHTVTHGAHYTNRAYCDTWCTLHKPCMLCSHPLYPAHCSLHMHHSKLSLDHTLCAYHTVHTILLSVLLTVMNRMLTHIDVCPDDAFSDATGAPAASHHLVFPQSNALWVRSASRRNTSSVGRVPVWSICALPLTVNHAPSLTSVSGLSTSTDQVCDAGRPFSIVVVVAEQATSLLLSRLINRQDVVFSGFGLRCP